LSVEIRVHQTNSQEDIIPVYHSRLPSTPSSLMKLQILSIATLIAPLCLAAPSLAQNPAHVLQLLKTNACQECDLSGANLKEVKLTSADLRGANLIGANLENANLSGANLTNSNLANVNFSNTNLSGANLSGANLVEANLGNTNLSEADLKYANLVSANFNGTKLRDADLSAANLAGVDLSRADMTGAKMLGANLVGAIGLSLPIFPNSVPSPEPTVGGEASPSNTINAPSGQGSGTRRNREGGYQPPSGIGTPGRTEGGGTYLRTPPDN